MATQDKEKLSKKDIYNRLWEGRNFEIEHLWQRSIFLGAFLIIFLTVYFTLLGSIFSAAKDASVNQSVISAESTMRGTLFTVAEKEEPDSSDILKYLSGNKGANVALLVDALLGASFSLLWIFMAKGSKYWYEKYENSIDQMQHDKELFDDAINKEWRIEEAKARLEYRGECHIPIQGHMPQNSSDDSIFSHKGGAYSLSRINVAIGHIFWLFWLLVSAFHIYLLFDYKLSTWPAGWTLLIALVLFALLTVLIGNSNVSGEADWTNSFRVFKRLQINKERCFKRNRKRRHENKWFIELLKAYSLKDIPEVIKKAEPILLKDNLTSKIKTAVKHPKNSADKEWLWTYLQENIFTEVYPSGMKVQWFCPQRRPIYFSPENKSDVMIEKSFLFDKYKKGTFPASSYSSLEVRKFADIPWNELKKKKWHREEKLASLENAENWTLRYILCDNDDQFLGCEIFNYSFYNGREKLESSFISKEGENIMNYIWKKV